MQKPPSDVERQDAPRVAIAIAHDYLTQRGGAERVVLSMWRAFPEATIHTTLYDPEGTYPEFKDANIVVSRLNKVGALRRNHRAALPLLPFLANHRRIDADVTIVSTSGWAHGFPTTGRKLVYCHSPARWVYLTDEYLGKSAKRSLSGWALLALRPFLRRWDQRAALTAESYVANSRVVSKRIQDVYGIDAAVVPPPHSMDPKAPQEPVPGVAAWADSPGYYLIVSRLLPYKNVQHVVEAFRGLEERLVIVGAGPMAEELRATAPDNVRLVSDLSDAQLRWTYAHARALIAPSHEDFGLTPLEVGAFGHPCLALRAGGYLDTIVDGVNGTFFEAPTAVAIHDAIVANRTAEWDTDAIRAHAATFAEAAFHQRLHRAVERTTSS